MIARPAPFCPSRNNAMKKFHISPAVKALAALQNPLLEFVREFLTDNGFELPEAGQAAREWCRSRAIAGDADAQLAYSQLLTHGLFGARDDDEAFLWIQRAAEQSHPAGMIALSPYLENGRENCPKDVARALDLIKVSAEKGYAPAWALLGIWYQFGTHVKEDRHLAMEYHRKAASLGFAGSQYTLGCDLIEQMNPSDQQEGLALIEAAARQNLYLAHETLGRLFSRGEFGATVDQERSRHHYQKAKKLEDEAGAAFGVLRPI